MKKIILLFFVAINLFFLEKVNAQCPPNLDFEGGNFNNWICNEGTVGVGTTNVQLNFPTIPTGPTTQHLLTTAAMGNDYFGGFPKKFPGSANNYSVRLGDTLFGSMAASIKYAVHVPAGQNKYTITYNYAFVLQASGHLPNESPSFSVAVYDSATNLAVNACGGFFCAFGSSTFGLPNFCYVSPNDPNCVYRPWTSEFIDLDSLAGKTIYVEFKTGDCAYGGHMGYGYIDFQSCNSSLIATQTSVGGYCAGATSITLTAPSGYNYYAWYDSSLTTFLSNSSILTVSPVPSTATTFAVQLYPYSNSCAQTFWVPFNPNPSLTANFGCRTYNCINGVTHFTDSSFSSSNYPVNKWQWNFGDAFANAANPNTDTVQNPSHVYTNFGSYTVGLIANSNSNCLADTLYKTIQVNLLSAAAPVIASNDTVCGISDTVSISYSGTSFSSYSYHWILDTATFLISGNVNAISPISIRYTSAGTHFVSLKATPGLLDTTCETISSTAIFVKGITPYFSIMSSDSICPNTSSQLIINADTASCGAAPIINCVGVNYPIGTNNGPTANTPTPFRGFYTESKCQMLYLASELQSMGFQGGHISEIAWNVLTKNSTSPSCSSNGQYSGFTIKMACVPYSSIYSGSSVTLDLATQLTTVYSTSAYNTVLGINNFVLTTPYNWDGVSNLLVQTCFDAGSSCYTGDDAVAKSTNPIGQNLCAYAFSDTYNGCDSTYGQAGNGNIAINVAERPDIIFNACNFSISPTANFNWTSSPVGFTSSAQSPIVSPTATTTYSVIANDNGCSATSLFTMNVVSQINLTIAASICAGQSYLFNGINLTTAGSYFDTLNNMSGCDTFITLNLAVLLPSTFAFSHAICNGSSFLFNGNNLSIPGTYYDTLTNYVGCDSLVTLNLTNGIPSTFSFTDSICSSQSYIFNGNNLTTSGIYYDTLTNYLGCDSIVTINFLVKISSSSTLNQTSCYGSSFLFNGNNLSFSGIYYDTITNYTGCDSIITLNLIVVPVISTNLYQSICTGNSFLFNGNNLIATGSYQDTLSSYQGCDSLLILNLTVDTPHTSISVSGVTLTVANNTAYQWIDCNTLFPIIGATNQSYTATLSGSYAAIVTQNNCIDTSVCNAIFINCNSYFNTDYDTTTNTFNLTIDTSISNYALSYHWDFGDGFTSNLAAPSHIYSVDTIYNVCLQIHSITGDSCTYCHIIGKDYLGNIIKTAGFSINVFNHGGGNGINQLQAGSGKLEVYPNPVGDKLSVIGYQLLGNTIHIYDVLGREVLNLQIVNHKSAIVNVSNLTSGVYFLKVTDEKGNIKTAKFVKE